MTVTESELLVMPPATARTTAVPAAAAVMLNNLTSSPGAGFTVVGLNVNAGPDTRCGVVESAVVRLAAVSVMLNDVPAVAAPAAESVIVGLGAGAGAGPGAGALGAGTPM